MPPLSIHLNLTMRCALILTTWNKSLFANNILKFKKLIVHFKMLIFCKARNVIATVKVRRSVFLQFPKVTVTCPNWQILPGLSNTNSCAFWLRQIAIEIFCHFTKYFSHRDSLNLSCQNVQVLLLAKMFIPSAYAELSELFIASQWYLNAPLCCYPAEARFKLESYCQMEDVLPLSYLGTVL